MLSVTLLLVSVLTGCTTVPVHKDHTDCDKVAAYARGIEVLKQVGVTQADIGSYTSHPTVASFPMQRVRSVVYLKTFDTPADAYNYFYTMCTDVGYNNMMAALSAAEQRELEALKPLQLSPTLKTTPKKRKKK